MIDVNVDVNVDVDDDVEDSSPSDSAPSHFVRSHRPPSDELN